MPSQHAPDKEPLALQVPRTTVMRIKRIARKRGCPVSHIVNEILAKHTHHVELTAADYEAIAKATRIAEQTGKRVATHYPDTP